MSKNIFCLIETCALI